MGEFFFYIKKVGFGVLMIIFFIIEIYFWKMFFY